MLTGRVEPTSYSTLSGVWRPRTSLVQDYTYDLSVLKKSDVQRQYRRLCNQSHPFTRGLVNFKGIKRVEITRRFKAGGIHVDAVKVRARHDLGPQWFGRSQPQGFGEHLATPETVRRKLATQEND